jgi:hypothetical protein
MIMRNDEKRSKVLDKIDDLYGDGGMAVATMVMDYMSDDNWANLYDRLEQDGMFEKDDDEDEERTDIDKAVDYVRENMDEDDMAILQAEMNQCYKAHIIPAENVMDCDKVIDLLNEYAEENDLPERWWEDECEIDEILVKL